MTDKLTIKNEIEQLRKKITEADKAYYIESNPIMSDQEYDSLYNRLLLLEKENPDFFDPNSPTTRVGSDIDNELPEKEHSVPILSLDKCYKTEDLMEWIKKTQNKIDREIEFVIEPKIDGAGVVLYYNHGNLEMALTRGNGYIGNEITGNVKTIRSVPLFIDFKKKLAVRGEVFIKKNEFENFNMKYSEGKYSNPRNLASGSIRRQKSKETSLFPLNIFIYEGFHENTENKKHLDILIELKELGFPLNEYLGFFSDNNTAQHLPFKNGYNGKIDDIPEYINNLNKIRHQLTYEIDGLVIKINDIESREKLGFTQHHPRWAIAYKFDSPFAETIIKSIDVQIGRGGRVTPVANLEPVTLAGSVISRATLHNQDYIDSLELNIGDRVAISKRGDVIPAVEEVLEKGDKISSYKIEKICPVCKTELVMDGAHLFCTNEECDGRLLGTLQYFVGRDQMDIESLGDKTLELLFNNKFIRYIPDIYEFDYNTLLGLEGFKEKKIANIKTAVNKSKEKNFTRVLSSLGLKEIGNKASELLVKKFKDIDSIIESAKKKNIELFMEIDGIGEGIAHSIISNFNNPGILKIINQLKKDGLNFKQIDNEITEEKEKFLTGTKWVITGSFENFKPREIAGELIKKFGGDVIDSVSSKTTHLLCGVAPGSKLEKAKTLNIKIINEKEFLKIIENKKK